MSVVVDSSVLKFQMFKKFCKLYSSGSVWIEKIKYMRCLFWQYVYYVVAKLCCSKKKWEFVLLER